MSSNDPQDKDIKRAQDYIEANPSTSRVALRTALCIAQYRIKCWEEAGLLRFAPRQYPQRKGPKKATEEKLKLVQAELAANPHKTTSQLAMQFSLGEVTIRKWRDAGWIKPGKAKKFDNTLYWLKKGPKYRPYDSTMVKVSKK